MIANEAILFISLDIISILLVDILGVAVYLTNNSLCACVAHTKTNYYGYIIFTSAGYVLSLAFLAMLATFNDLLAYYYERRYIAQIFYLGQTISY